MATPCEERGWKVGDLFKVSADTTCFKEGDIVELREDDGDLAPLFVSVVDDGESHYVNIKDIIPVKDTPCTRSGYLEGDQFIITNDHHFTKGSAIELEEDDGTTQPLFRLISGECVWNNAKHDKPGAYEFLTNVRKTGNKSKIKTPCESEGMHVGDLFEITDSNRLFTQGSIVELDKDDGDDAPLCKLINGAYNNSSEGSHYVSIEGLSPVEDTPCIRAGYFVGDQFSVIKDCEFTEGSLVVLEKDDGSHTPLFRLINGRCSYQRARGNLPGAYTSLDDVQKFVSGDHTSEDESDCGMPAKLVAFYVASAEKDRKKIKELRHLLIAFLDVEDGYGDPDEYSDLDDEKYWGYDEDDNDTDFYHCISSYGDDPLELTVDQAIQWLRKLAGVEAECAEFNSHTHPGVETINLSEARVARITPSDAVIAEINGVEYLLTATTASELVGALLTIKSAKV